MAKDSRKEEKKRFVERKTVAAKRLAKSGGLSFQQAISKVFRDGKYFK